jgi:hypothetical protein
VIAARLGPTEDSPSTHSISNGLPPFDRKLGCLADKSSFTLMFPAATIAHRKLFMLT